MRQYFSAGYIICSILCFSCASKSPIGKPIGDPVALQQDLRKIWEYRAANIRLYAEFTPLDAAMQIIPKKAFMQQLATGNYFPVRMQTTDTIPAYQLYPYTAVADEEIKTVMHQWAKEEYEQYAAEGQQLPPFDFVDMKGNRYTSDNTKGKTVVLKCWFVNCLPCKQEMPALNKIQQQYANREDILFLSPCLDDKKKVDSFLQKTTFTYAVVPDQNTYLSETLQLKAYPTHFVIDKEGRIISKLTDYHGMEYILQKIASRQ